MSFKDAFLGFLRTGRRTLQVNSDEDAEDVQAVILGAHLLGKWTDVEYVGEGAAAAEAERRRRLGLEETPETAVISQTKKKRHRLTKKERLERRLRRLQTDIKKLEKGLK